MKRHSRGFERPHPHISPASPPPAAGAVNVGATRCMCLARSMSSTTNSHSRAPQSDARQSARTEAFATFAAVKRAFAKGTNAMLITMCVCRPTDRQRGRPRRDYHCQKAATEHCSDNRNRRDNLPLTITNPPLERSAGEVLTDTHQKSHESGIVNVGEKNSKISSSRIGIVVQETQKSTIPSGAGLRQGAGPKVLAT